jgi:hypothetical protein
MGLHFTEFTRRVGSGCGDWGTCGELFRKVKNCVTESLVTGLHKLFSAVYINYYKRFAFVCF